MAYFGIPERRKEQARKEAELRELTAILARHRELYPEEVRQLLEDMQAGVTTVRILASVRGTPAVISITRDVVLIEGSKAMDS